MALETVTEDDMDDDPIIKIQLANGAEAEATRHNTILFMHLGHAAMYDHVYVRVSDEENTGAFVFRQNPMFEQFVDQIKKHRYEMHLNIPEVAEADVAAWNRIMADEVKDLEAGIPEEWISNEI